MKCGVALWLCHASLFRLKMNECDQSANQNTEPSLLDGVLDFGEEDVVFFEEEQSALTEPIPETAPVANANDAADSSLSNFVMEMDDANPVSENVKVRSEFRRCMNMTFAKYRPVFKVGVCNLKAMPTLWNVGKLFRMSELSACLKTSRNVNLMNLKKMEQLNLGKVQLPKKTKILKTAEFGTVKLDNEKKLIDENLNKRSKEVKLEDCSPSKGGMMSSVKSMEKTNTNDFVRFGQKEPLYDSRKMNDKSWSKKERNSLNDMDNQRKKDEDLFEERSSKSKKTMFDSGFESKKSSTSDMSMNSNEKKGDKNWNL